MEFISAITGLVVLSFFIPRNRRRNSIPAPKPHPVVTGRLRLLDVSAHLVSGHNVSSYHRSDGTYVSECYRRGYERGAYLRRRTIVALPRGAAAKGGGKVKA